MIKPQAKLGAILVIIPIIIMTPLLFLLAKYPKLSVIILEILGPIALMTFALGLFLLIAGLIKKKENKA